MFLKQYNYKPRSNSQSSQGSGSASGSPPKEEPKTTTEATGAAGNAAAAAAGRRRSSASDKYAGLTAMKRGSQDERKASWTEQKAGTGILGGMWNQFTRGSS
ncbi:hypothetical protein A1O7_01779 [Cladophialophora yegresii CBS 114405]|uniref:Uncharacterized protein n=1 Tax=Cladophialophora yegresii CBS 114405 TaxID=1182544 RepID=W9WBY1_9EURO|nr:uncharacterized protein A1O7_01779 [Cladophialophora yegresii CBS 114405]EXJ65438.1 hypothetical protein A1O7_01779 [Cladophialophora yegresii CBS 114405]